MTQHSLIPDKLQYYPNLNADNHHITSDESRQYNCIAWAAGDPTRWWDPNFGYYWPTGVLRELDNFQSFVELFAHLGYSPCASDPEDTDENIVLYVTRGSRQFTHVAAKLASGKWTSKLGRWEDIEHDTPQDLEGDGAGGYGVADTYMRKERAT